MNTKIYLKVSLANAAFFTLLAWALAAIIKAPVLPVMVSTFVIVFCVTLWAVCAAALK